MITSKRNGELSKLDIVRQLQKIDLDIADAEAMRDRIAILKLLRLRAQIRKLK